MKEVVSSAPGKVILFGEHAVVYGQPSLAGAIDLRVFVKVTENKAKKIKIISDNCMETVDFNELNPEGRFRYVKKALDIFFNEIIQVCRGVTISINSELPSASGLGSSAAVTVATMSALSRFFGTELKKEEIARLSHRVELEVQGAASPTDTLTSTFGGILFIEPLKKKYSRLSCSSLPLVIGYTGDPRSTAELVRKVRELRDKYPDIIDGIILQIGEITKKAKKCLEGGELHHLGELMNINHGLLESLGVSTEKLSRLVYISRKAGARGAKLTGAGGGGCIIAYTPEKEENVIKAIAKEKCKPFRAPITADGVKIENF